MSDFSKLVLDHLATIYLISNTPAFLYDRFLAEQSIHSLANNKTAHELVSTATQIAAKADRTPIELAIGYSALVALTLKNFREVMVALDGQNLSGLEWSDRILELWKQTVVNTTIIITTVKPRVDSPQTMVVGPISTACHTVVAKVEPKIKLAASAETPVALTDVVITDSKGLIYVQK